MRYIFITGSSSGIGRALALELLDNKDNYIYGISRSNSLNHSNYRHFTLDLSDLQLVQDFKFTDFNDAESVVLVNNAGTLGDVKHLGNIDNDLMIAAYNTNLAAPAILLNNFIKAYAHSSANRLIINVTSGAAQSPVDGWSTYCSAKAGLDMLTRVAAQEQEKDNGGIKIMAVAPGIVDTQMQDQIRQSSKKDFNEVQRFIEYKEGGQLADAAVVAKKYADIIYHPEKYNEVVFRS